MSGITPPSTTFDPLLLWHNHRVELLLLVGVLIAVVRLARLRRRDRCSEILHTSLKTPFANSNGFPLVQEPHIESPSESNPTRTVPKPGPKRINGKKGIQATSSTALTQSPVRLQPVVFYFSLGGSTRARAETLAISFSDLHQGVLPAEIHDLAEIDHDDHFVSLPRPEPNTQAKSFLYLFLIPSYDIDTELINFLSNLAEIHNDFRIDTAPLSQISGYAVLGFGSSQDWPTEESGFCSQAVEVDRWMSKLTAGKRAFPIGMADVNSKDVQTRIDTWCKGVREITVDLTNGHGLGEGVPGSGDAYESGDEATDLSGDEDTKTVPRKQRKRVIAGDVEDIKPPIPVDFTSMSRSAKPMVPVTSPTYASLTKQGYSIVGTHSGVKICRWTKSALRGRGSCYKYSFYGIASHRCMEATPSLSCSNKCVFCWRHGTNPVGTTWRWQVDPPDLIFDGIKKEHYRKIKMLRGVPGVRAERFEEGMQIRHCALSLVGEPIFYPHINELLAMLHKEHISSFLVCNAQHPDQLATLGPVTQLYVSIDASNKESLRRIDRPLHRDYWERFIRCMDILRAKRDTHRTVFRLTLVKGFNIDEEAEGYAELVERARPSFVEVKGVTYCGTSTAAGAGLTMQNVPFYEEVTAFVLALESALQRRGMDYGIGAEHAHSCCILLADKRRFFKVPADSTDSVKRWHTTIDYDRFFSLLESGRNFGPDDYIGPPTAEWALWGNGGFDPRDVRVDHKGRPKAIS